MTSGVVDLGRDNDVRLRRLRTALALGTGFQLVIVEAEPGPIRKEVLRRIQSWSGRDNIGLLASISLDAHAPLQTQLNLRSGVIVTGLEPSSSINEAARDWIGELNWSRDSLPGLIPGPLILVVSRGIHQVLFEHAADLYSWRRHTIRVELVVQDLVRPLSSPDDPYWLQQRRHFASLLSGLLHSIPGQSAVVDRIILIGGPGFLARLADVLLQLGNERDASHALGRAALFEDSESHAGMMERCKLQRVNCAIVRHDLIAAGVLLGEVSRETDFAMLLRGKLHALDGAWDAAVVELSRAVELARIDGDQELLARARECLCQVALARGDLIAARNEINELIDVARIHCDEWGAGLLLRLADAGVDVYPNEIIPLLDAVTASSVSHRPDVAFKTECLHVKRAWLLQCPSLAREALTRERNWIEHDAEPPNPSQSFCEAIAALTIGSSSEDEIVALLSHARELFRAVAPRQAAIVGCLLGKFSQVHGSLERAVAAYRGAAEDARRAGVFALGREAELCELIAAVEGEIESDNASDRLRVIADHFQAEGCDQSEAVARAGLGRCLLRRGRREHAVAELERARACFAATTDLAGQNAVMFLLDTTR